MPHKTPTSLNANLRLGRLTLPHWAAIGVGALALWIGAALTGAVRDPNLRLAAVCLPTVLLIAPILALGRGGIERYPVQALRYAGRQARAHTIMATLYVRALLREGAHYVRIQAARRQR